MSIFNSLGSNYNGRFIGLAIKELIWPAKNTITKLHVYLQKRFHGQVFLFFKGRDAIEFTLKYFNIGPGDQVITQAFTCFAIEEAIQRTGAQALYADLDQNSLNPNVETLNQAFRKGRRVKAVIIQHTLGSVADIIAIKKFCQKNQLLLIEDLAQGLGGVDQQGQELGTLADAVIISFGRDKMVDAVSGGTAIIKNQLQKKSSSQAAEPMIKQNKIDQALRSQKIAQRFILKDLIYPLLTWIIRSTYELKIGKIIHFLAKKTALMGNPIFAPNQSYLPLPPAYASLILYQFAQLEASLHHRRQIANYYAAQLPKKIQITQANDLQYGSNLRFAIILPNVDQILTLLDQAKIYLADRWYRQAVDCGPFKCQSHYQPSSCPNAEKLSREVINLPTHRFISLRDAKKICQTINNEIKK